MSRAASSRTRSSLRVGLVCPYSFDTPGGVQNHLLGLAGYLLAQGHEPYILAPGDAEPLVGAGLDSARFTSAGQAIPVRYNGSTARVNFGPLTAARVRRWLNSTDLDVLHLHEPITPSVSILALWAAEVPVVATFHTATPRSRTMQLAGGALRASIEKITAGIAVSAAARRVVVQHLGRDALVIPNGFQLADFRGPRPAGRWRGGDRPRLLFLGRVDEPRKGLDVLLAALPEILRAQPDLDIVVAGLGSRALPPTVRAVGLVSDAERAELLATSDVFVGPHTERESFGIVLLEAMASGAAVVASDLEPFVDLLQAEPAGSELGSVFPAGDSAALAATVGEVLSGRRHDRTERGVAEAARYDWSVVGRQITEVYRAAVHSDGAAREVLA